MKNGIDNKAFLAYLILKQKIVLIKDRYGENLTLEGAMSLADLQADDKYGEDEWSKSLSALLPDFKEVWGESDNIRNECHPEGKGNNKKEKK